MQRFGLVTLLALAACTQPVPIKDETSPPPLPEASYAAAAREGAAVYRILPQASMLLVHVRRAGTLQKLGHDHAVTSPEVQGFVEIGDQPSASRANVVVPIRSLVIDQPRYRQQLNLDAGPTDEDIAGTYANMLKVFEPQQYPWIEAEARLAAGTGSHPALTVSITLHGTTAEFRIPVNLEFDADRLAVSGHTVIKQSDFGVVPYSTAGGLLRVADDLEVQFRLVGTAWPGPS